MLEIINRLPIDKIFVDEVHLWRRWGMNLDLATAASLLKIIPWPPATAWPNVQTSQYNRLPLYTCIHYFSIIYTETNVNANSLVLIMPQCWCPRECGLGLVLRLLDTSSYWSGYWAVQVGGCKCLDQRLPMGAPIKAIYIVNAPQCNAPQDHNPWAKSQ